MKIVIIDDEQDICDALKIMLENVGHEVEIFIDPTEAMSWLDQKKCDAIICDFIMPKMSGEDVKNQVRSESYDKFYLFTGETALSPEKLEDMKFDMVFIKPGGLLEIVKHLS